MSIRKIRNLLVLIILLCTSISYAQFGSYGLTNARNVGLANTYTANSYGLYSIGINPGLLNKMPDEEQISVLFPSLTARGYGLSRTIESFKYYVGIIDDRAINRIDSENLLNTLQEGGTASLSAVVGFFSVAVKPNEEIGTFAFTVTDYIAAYLHFPGFVADAVVNGIDFDGSLSLEEFTYKTWWIRSYGLSYSRRLFHDPEGKILQGITAGASIKYYNGFLYQDIVIDASAATSSQDTLLQASFNARSRNSFSSDLTFLNFFLEDGKEPDNFMFPKAAGKRMGFDLGFSAELNKGLTVGMALTDIGKLKWQSNAGKRNINASFYVFGNLDETLIDSISGDATVSDRIDEDFTVPLPTAFRLGVAWQFDQIFRRFPGQMRLAFDFNKGFNNEPSNFVKPRYSFGVEYRPTRVGPILLTGISYDKDNQTQWALGLGCDTKFMEFYISTMDMVSIIGGSEFFSISAIFHWKIHYKKQ